MSKKSFNKFQRGGESNRKSNNRRSNRTQPRPNTIPSIGKPPKVKPNNFGIHKDDLDCRKIIPDPNNPEYSFRTDCKPKPSQDGTIPVIPYPIVECRADLDCPRGQKCNRGKCTEKIISTPQIIGEIEEQQHICNGVCDGQGDDPDPDTTELDYSVNLIIESYLIDVEDGYVDTEGVTWAYSKGISAGNTGNTFYYLEGWIETIIGVGSGHIRVNGISTNSRSFNEHTVSFTWIPNNPDPAQNLVEDKIYNDLQNTTINVGNFLYPGVDGTCEQWGFVTCDNLGSYAGTNFCELTVEDCQFDSGDELFICGKTGEVVNDLEDCYSTRIMRDGKVWMTEDLVQTTIAGNELQQISDNEWQLGSWPYLQTPVVYTNSTNGYLYNYEAVDDGICPSGWRVPNAQDWRNLFDAYGGMEGNSSEFKSTMFAGTNSSGFDVKPSGYINDTNGWGYYFPNDATNYWSSTLADELIAYAYSFYRFNNSVLELLDYQNSYIGNLYSIRCVRGDVTEDFDPGDNWYENKEEYNFLNWRPSWLCILQPEECGGSDDMRRWRHPGSNEQEIVESVRQFTELGYTPAISQRDNYYEYPGEDGTCPEHPSYFDASQPDNPSNQYPIVNVGEMPGGCWRKTYNPDDLGGIPDIGCCDGAIAAFGEMTSWAVGLNDCRVLDSWYHYYCGGCNCATTPNSFYYNLNLEATTYHWLDNNTGDSFGLGPSCPDYMCVGGTHDGKYCDPTITGGVDEDTCINDGGGYGCSQGSGCSWGHKYDLGGQQIQFDVGEWASAWWNIHDRSCCPGCANPLPDDSCVGDYDLTVSEDIDWSNRYNYSEVPGVGGSAVGNDWYTPPTSWESYCISICENYTDFQGGISTPSCLPNPVDMCSSLSQGECGTWEIGDTIDPESDQCYAADGTGIIGGCCGWSAGLNQCVYKGCSAYHECASRCFGNLDTGDILIDPDGIPDNGDEYYDTCIDFCQPGDDWGLSLCKADFDEDGICDEGDVGPGVDPDLTDVIDGLEINECSGTGDYSICPTNCFGCNNVCCTPGTGDCHIEDECGECVSQDNINYLDNGCGCNAPQAPQSYWLDDDGDGYGTGTPILLCPFGGIGSDAYTLTSTVEHYPNVSSYPNYVQNSSDPDDACPCNTAHLLGEDGNPFYCNGCCIPLDQQGADTACGNSGFPNCAKKDSCDNCIYEADLLNACTGDAFVTCGSYLDANTNDILGSPLMDAGCDGICSTTPLQEIEYWYDEDGDGLGYGASQIICPNLIEEPCLTDGTPGYCTNNDDFLVEGSQCWCPEADTDIGGACIDCSGSCRWRDPLDGSDNCISNTAHVGCAYLDMCGNCVDESAGDTPCVADCADEDNCNGDWIDGACWGGTFAINDCGECVDGGVTGKIYGCNLEVECGPDSGLCFDELATECTAFLSCGNCVTEFSNCSDAGDPYCGEGVYCPAGSPLDEQYPISACGQKDCNGDCNGTAIIDECGNCVGGLTECSPEQNGNIPPFDVNGNPNLCVDLGGGIDGGLFNETGPCCYNWENKGCGCNSNLPTLHHYDDDGDGYPTLPADSPTYSATNYCISGFDGTTNSYTVYTLKPANTDCNSDGLPGWCDEPINQGWDLFPNCFSESATDNPYDCNGDCNGGAELDSCNVCTGGGTGLTANYLQDCSGACTCEDEGVAAGGDPNGVAINCQNNYEIWYYDGDGDGMGDMGLDNSTSSTCQEQEFCVPTDDTTSYSPNCTDADGTCFSNEVDQFGVCVPDDANPGISESDCPFPTIDAHETTGTDMNANLGVLGCGILSDACGTPCAGYDLANSVSGPECSYWNSITDYGGLKDCNNACPSDGAGYGADVDLCGVCAGGGTGLEPNANMDCRVDILGENSAWCNNLPDYGTAYEYDACQQCTPVDNPTYQDCFDVCQGSNITDDCGECACPSLEEYLLGNCGENNLIANSQKDCAGVCHGGSVVDGCGQCICGLTASNYGCGSAPDDDSGCPDCEHSGGFCTCVIADVNYLDLGCGCGQPAKTKYCKDTDGDSIPDFPTDPGTMVLELCSNDYYQSDGVTPQNCGGNDCVTADFYYFINPKCGFDGGWCPCDGPGYDHQDESDSGWDQYPDCECNSVACNGCCNDDLLVGDAPATCVEGSTPYPACLSEDDCGNCGGDCFGGNCPTDYGLITNNGGVNTLRYDCTGECVLVGDYQENDECGVCGGPGRTKECDCGCQNVCPDDNCPAACIRDACGTCGGTCDGQAGTPGCLECGCTGVPVGDCNCFGDIELECGCGIDIPGMCGGATNAEGREYCDCDCNVLDDCNVCGGLFYSGNPFCGQSPDIVGNCCDCEGTAFPNGFDGTQHWESDCGCVAYDNSGDDCDDCAEVPNGPGQIFVCGEGAAEDLPCGPGGCASTGSPSQVCSTPPFGECDCNSIDGDGTPHVDGCDGVCNSGHIVDLCGVCAAPGEQVDVTTQCSDQDGGPQSGDDCCDNVHGSCDAGGDAAPTPFRGCDGKCYDYDPSLTPGSPGDIDECGVCNGLCTGVPTGQITYNSLFNTATGGFGGVTQSNNTPGWENECYVWNGGCYDCNSVFVGAGGPSGYDVGGICDGGVTTLDFCGNYQTDVPEHSAFDAPGGPGCQCAPTCLDQCFDQNGNEASGTGDYSHFTNRTCVEYVGGGISGLTCQGGNQRDCWESPSGQDYPLCDGQTLIGSSWGCNNASGCYTSSPQYCNSIPDNCGANPLGELTVAQIDWSCQGSPGTAACTPIQYDCETHDPSFNPVTYPYCDGFTSHLSGYCSNGTCRQESENCDLANQCFTDGYYYDYRCNDGTGLCDSSYDNCDVPPDACEGNVYKYTTSCSNINGCYFADSQDCDSIEDSCNGDDWLYDYNCVEGSGCVPTVEDCSGPDYCGPGLDGNSLAYSNLRCSNADGGCTADTEECYFDPVCTANIYYYESNCSAGDCEFLTNNCTIHKINQAGYTCVDNGGPGSCSTGVENSGGNDGRTYPFCDGDILFEKLTCDSDGCKYTTSQCAPYGTDYCFSDVAYSGAGCSGGDGFASCNTPDNEDCDPGSMCVNQNTYYTDWGCTGGNCYDETAPCPYQGGQCIDMGNGEVAFKEHSGCNSSTGCTHYHNSCGLTGDAQSQGYMGLACVESVDNLSATASGTALVWQNDCVNGTGCLLQYNSCSSANNKCGDNELDYIGNGSFGNNGATYSRLPGGNPNVLYTPTGNCIWDSASGGAEDMAHCQYQSSLDCSQAQCIPAGGGDYYAVSPGDCRHNDGGDDYCQWGDATLCTPDQGGCVVTEDGARCACPHGYKNLTLGNGVVRSICITDCMAAAPYCQFNLHQDGNNIYTNEPYQIGDGTCDYLCNVPECGYDGGDCCEDTCFGSSCGTRTGGAGTNYNCIDPDYRYSDSNNENDCPEVAAGQTHCNYHCQCGENKYCFGYSGWESYGDTSTLGNGLHGCWSCDDPDWNLFEQSEGWGQDGQFGDFPSGNYVNYWPGRHWGVSDRQKFGAHCNSAETSSECAMAKDAQGYSVCNWTGGDCVCGEPGANQQDWNCFRVTDQLNYNGDGLQNRDGSTSLDGSAIAFGNLGISMKILGTTDDACWGSQTGNGSWGPASGGSGLQLLSSGYKPFTFWDGNYTYNQTIYDGGPCPDGSAINWCLGRNLYGAPINGRADGGVENYQNALAKVQDGTWQNEASVMAKQERMNLITQQNLETYSGVGGINNLAICGDETGNGISCPVDLFTGPTDFGPLTWSSGNDLCASIGGNCVGMLVEDSDWSDQVPPGGGGPFYYHCNTGGELLNVPQQQICEDNLGAFNDGTFTCDSLFDIVVQWYDNYIQENGGNSLLALSNFSFSGGANYGYPPLVGQGGMRMNQIEWAACHVNHNAGWRISWLQDAGFPSWDWNLQPEYLIDGGREMMYSDMCPLKCMSMVQNSGGETYDFCPEGSGPSPCITDGGLNPCCDLHSAGTPLDDFYNGDTSGACNPATSWYYHSQCNDVRMGHSITCNTQFNSSDNEMASYYRRIIAQCEGAGGDEYTPAPTSGVNCDLLPDDWSWLDYFGIQPPSNQSQSWQLQQVLPELINCVCNGGTASSCIPAGLSIYD